MHCSNNQAHLPGYCNCLVTQRYTQSTYVIMQFMSSSSRWLWFCCYNQSSIVLVVTAKPQGGSGGSREGAAAPVRPPPFPGGGGSSHAPRRGANTDGAPNFGISERESGIDTLHQAPKKGANTKRSTRKGCQERGVRGALIPLMGVTLPFSGVFRGVRDTHRKGAG